MSTPYVDSGQATNDTSRYRDVIRSRSQYEWRILYIIQYIWKGFDDQNVKPTTNFRFSYSKLRLLCLIKT